MKGRGIKSFATRVFSNLNSSLLESWNLETGGVTGFGFDFFVYFSGESFRKFHFFHSSECFFFLIKKQYNYFFFRKAIGFSNYHSFALSSSQASAPYDINR